MPHYPILKHILAQLKKCGNKIVTLFIIVFENLHFSLDFLLAVPDTFLDLLAALGGAESVFSLFSARFALLVEETAPGFALTVGFFVDIFLGFVTVALSFPALSVFSLTDLVSPTRVGHSVLLHSETAG